MKRVCMLVGVVGALSALSVQASLQIVLQQDTSNYSYGDGGEFRASGSVISVNPGLAGYSAATAGAGYFQTFCIEVNEYFTPGVTYNVTISDEALYDGGAAPGGNPISIGTAWLYSQFAAGTLSGYTYGYGAGRTVSAGELQQAIWWLEGQAGGVKNSFITTAEAALGRNDTTIMNDANGLYGVVALNLWDSNGDPCQDQLMVVPEPTTVIAGLLLVLPLGVSAARVLWRKYAV